MPHPKALVIRLSALGDIVLATSAIQSLQSAGYKVSFVVKKEFSPLLQDHPRLEEVYSFDKELGESKARALLIEWARLKKFEFILDLQDSWRTRLWRIQLNSMAPVFVLRKPRIREFLVLWLRLGRWLGLRPGDRAVRFERAANQLASLRSNRTALTHLFVNQEEQEKVRKLLPLGEFAVIVPGSAWKGKEWPYYPQLASILAAKVPVVILGSYKDSICDVVEASAQRINPNSRSLKGITNLRETMAVLAQARWIIGNDTGLIHVGEALGKDVAVIEGPTHSYLGFSPYRPGSIRLGLSLVCRPCSKSGKFCLRFGTRKCLNGLSVETVVQTLHQSGFPC